MHLGLVLVIALLVFGPKKLPEIGKELGKAIREFKRASRDVMDSFHDAMEDRPHPVSTYDYASPALSAYQAPEDTFHRAADASSLGEPAPAAAPAPPGAVERPPHSTAAAAPETPAVLDAAAAPAENGSAAPKSGGEVSPKAGAAVESQDHSSGSGQETTKTLERTA